MDSSVASSNETVYADNESELTSGSTEDVLDYPFSQELISNSGESLERENLSVGNESNDSENSLFQASSSYVPTRTKRILRGKEQTLGSSSTLNLTSKYSDYQPISQQISEYLKNPYRRRRQKRTARKKKSKISQKAAKRTQTSNSLVERRRRLFDSGIQFPCVPSKYLPLKQYFTYEQLVLGGFLNQVKNLKYEHTLKKGLKDVNVDEDPDNENIDIRKYSFLDDDGPISPISEPGENLNEEEPEEEIEVVENSDFILNCQMPSKKNWRIKKEKEK